MAEHRLERVVQYADRVVLVPGGGRPVVSGPPAEILATAPVAPPVVELGRLAGWSPLPLSVRDARRLAGDLTERLRAATPPVTVGAVHGDLVAEARGIVVRYAGAGGPPALRGVDLRLRAGEVVALMGRNGAGKSTTMKTIIGLMARRQGTVRFNGEDISNRKPFEIARRGLGFTPEDRRIFVDLTVMENLDVGRQLARHFADGRPAPSWTPEQLFRLFPNLAEMPDRLGGRMSGGEQQMLTVARTLMGNPLLVLLDEPSEGVAPLIVEQMANTILELKKQGLSILLSEQNIHFARLVSDRVYVLEKGQIHWQGSVAELDANPEVQRTYLTV